MQHNAFLMVMVAVVEEPQRYLLGILVVIARVLQCVVQLGVGAGEHLPYLLGIQVDLVLVERHSRQEGATEKVQAGLRPIQVHQN